MIPVTRLNHAALYVRELEQSVAQPLRPLSQKQCRDTRLIHRSGYRRVLPNRMPFAQ